LCENTLSQRAVFHPRRDCLKCVKKSIMHRHHIHIKEKPAEFDCPK
jgi:hypothetical protein